MSRTLRYAFWFVLPAIIILLLMWTNDHVGDLYHLQRVQPFALMAIAKLILIAVLTAQHPGPRRGTPGWQVWRWVDPLAMCLVAMLLSSAIYFTMLWGGNGQRFQPPAWGYTTARMIMWADGYILIMVGSELLYRSLKARREEWIRMKRTYDIPAENRPQG